MHLDGKIEQSIGRALDHLRKTQDQLGRWMGGNCGIDAPFYAIGLVLDDEPVDSLRVKDIFNFFASCQTPQGGLGHFPGEPANGFHTSFILPFMKWANPSSPVIERMEQYLKKTGQRYRDPLTRMARWVCLKQDRESLLKDCGPPAFIRKIGLHLSARHASVRVPIGQQYPRRYQQQKWFDFIVLPEIIRALTYPSLDNLEEAERVAPIPTGFDIQLLICSSLMKLSGDTKSGAKRLFELARDRRKRFIFDDDSYEWISVLVADMFFTTVFELEPERSSARRAFRQIDYQGNGWLNADCATPHIFDTSLTLLALNRLGLPLDDPMVQKAFRYLRKAPSPQRGLWAWSYTEGMNDRRPYADSDDTGASMMALAAYGEPSDSEIFQKARAGLLELQDQSGGFSTFDETLKPNWLWVSNSARALQGLYEAGMRKTDQRLALGLKWIADQQNPDGSWVDGWGARYVYGTACALEALLRLGWYSTTDNAVIKARQWLLAEQNSDGGWGENWAGERVPSTCEHTGLAVYGLSLTGSGDDSVSEAICRGAQWLIDHQKADGSWDCVYFINFGYGAGLADRQVPMIFALQALASARKFAEKSLPERV